MRPPAAVRLAEWLFARLTPVDAAEFVLGDLAEQAVARLRRGDRRLVVHAWHVGQLARSLPPIWSGVPAWHRAVRSPRAGAGLARVVRDGLMGLRRSPARAAAIVALMALGVGANATMFGALDRIFLEPPAHVRDPDSVKRFFVNIHAIDAPEMRTQAIQTWPDYRDWSTLDVFESTAAYWVTDLIEGTGGSAERIPVTLTTASFFDLLGAQPALGRFYDERDDAFAAAPVAVLGHAYWQRRFGGDADAIGRTLHIGDQTYTVVGVAPADFTGIELERVDVWLPLHPAAMVEQGGNEWEDARGWYWIQTIARLASGVTVERAEAAATLAHRTGRTELEGYNDRDPRVEMASITLARTSKASAEARVLPWVMGVAVMVLLLTCANVANLLLASGFRERRARAVRTALGASRARLTGTVVVESLGMALLGGIAAVAVAHWGGELLRTTLFPGVQWARGADTFRVALFSAALAAGAGLLTGIIPALRAGHVDPASALRTAGRGMTRGRSRLREGLLVLQAAISVVLLVGTGLFVRSLSAARRVDLGFDPDGVLLVMVQPEGGYPGGEAMAALYRRTLETLEELPGDRPMAIATTVPFQNSRGIGDDLKVPGRDSLPTTGAGGAYINAVTGGFFEASGLRILRGRGITETDDAPDAPRVAVVNETMARLVWPDGDALGSCIILRDAPCAEVVGISSDSRRYELDEYESMNYYVPLAQTPYPWPPRGILIRSDDPAALAPTVQRLITDRLSGIRFVGTQPYRQVVDPTYRSWQLGATLFAGFGLLALLVASVGLYSVLAFDVAERRREMGLRSALGATRARIIGFVVGDGLRLAGIGVVLGLAAGFVAAPYARALLFGVSPRDPRILAGVAIAMLLVSAVACGLPAWRAARVDPNETLRAE